MLDGIFKTILDMTLSASFLIAAVLIARVILRKSPKLFRKILWGLVALKLVIPYSFESVLSLVPHKSTYMPQNEVVSQGASDTMASAFNWESVLPYAWVVVAVLLLVYALVSFIKLKVRMSDAVKFQDNVFQSEKVESPFVFGIFNPRIYIPYNIKGEKLRVILEHEKTHIKNFDHVTKILGFVILCVHWFNPLVWVSYVLFCKDLELACDEAVVKNMSDENRKAYARTLINIGVNNAKITACPIAFGEVSIKERVKSALSYKKVGKIAISLSLCLCAVVAVCFMTKPVAEAKEKIEETVVEETTLPDMEAITEPTTELTTESITEPVTEEATTESSVVTVEEDAFAESRERLLRELEKNKTTAPQTTGKDVGAAYNSLQNSCYIIKENSGSGAAAYDGDVIIETHETANSSGNGSNNGFKNPFVNKYY
ncbi:MAG: hypothetical protein IKT55_02045 [Clostridia bacterium]|nr:hypothetical protein [Clostridia bacterium]